MIDPQDRIYHPKNKEDCAHLLAKRYEFEESQKPENFGLSAEGLHSVIYFRFMKMPYPQLKAIYYNGFKEHETKKSGLSRLEKKAEDLQLRLF